MILFHSFCKDRFKLCIPMLLELTQLDIQWDDEV